MTAARALPAGYRGLAELDAGLAIGATRGGRTIRAQAFGAGGPTTLVVAGVHPIEWIGVEVARALAAALAAAPPPDRRVVIVPVLNPDGYAAVEADLRAGRRRWHRTSGRDGRSLGVDLNRNFPIAHRAPPAWWRGLPHGGAAPWSEPETRALAAIVEDPRWAPIDRAVSLHAFGRVILLPWAHRRARPPRYRELRAHAEAIAARMPERYRVWQAGRVPPGGLAGLELDWLTSRGALTLLVECTGGGFGLTAPATWTSPFAWYNPADGAARAAPIARALEPFVRGA